jgi:hypothetical protein
MSVEAWEILFLHILGRGRLQRDAPMDDSAHLCMPGGTSSLAALVPCAPRHRTLASCLTAKVSMAMSLSLPIVANGSNGDDDAVDDGT